MSETSLTELVEGIKDTKATAEESKKVEPTGEALNEKYIGEGKKYNSSDDALKSVGHSQAYIDKLEQENAGLRQHAMEADGRYDTTDRRLTEIMDKLVNRDQGTGQTTPMEQAPQGETATGPASVSLEDMKAEIASQFGAISATQNVQRSQDLLLKAFGSKEAVVHATESIKSGSPAVETFLNDLSKQNPEEFVSAMKRFGDAPKQPAITSTEGLNQRTPATNQLGINGWSHWQKLLISDQTAYTRAESVRNREREVCAQQGIDFFTT